MAIKSISPSQTSSSIFSRITSGAKRSFEWIKNHPAISIAIAAIAVAGVYAAASGLSSAPSKTSLSLSDLPGFTNGRLDPFKKSDQPEDYQRGLKFQDEMLQHCKEAAGHEYHLNPNKIQGEQITTEYGTDLLCWLKVKQTDLAKVSTPTWIQYPMEKISSVWRQYFGAACAHLADCDHITFKTFISQKP